MRLLTYLRGAALGIWFPIHSILCGVVICTFGIFLPFPWFADFVIRTLWARPVLWLARIHVEVRGLGNWPEGKGALVIFNHTSWMDIVILVTCLPRIPRFGAKIELFRIPFFGRAMRRVGMLPIERHQRSRVLEVYRAAEARAQAGECFALAPEGTRQKDLVLGKFKQGPFLFAIGAQIPVVPVLLSGARELMPKGTILINANHWTSRVLVEIMQPSSTSGLDMASVGGFQQTVREKMIPAYAKLNSELGLE